MNFILKQIKFSERHADGEELLDILPNASLPWGLRTVDGSFNNLTPDQTGFGQADLEFLSIVEPEYPNAQTLTAPMANNDVPGAKTSYVRGDGRTVQDSTPRLISNLIVNQSTMNPAAVQAAADEDGTLLGPDIAGADQFLIPNTAPDEGLSAPFNLFMTFFGQFFDHGLDLVNKGGNGVVFMPLAQDDPLYDKGADGIAGTEDDGKTNFMMMTRASRNAGPDGLIGTADDEENIINATTPHVDQQQTYASHASNQILLRHYEMVDGCPQSSGKLLNGYGNDKTLDTDDDGGMATWDTAQAQAATKLGIALDDLDGANVPHMLADPYGEFVRGENCLPQLVIGIAENGTPITVEGSLMIPVDATQAMRVNQSFFLDVAHTANPGSFVGVGIEPKLAPDADDAFNARIDTLSGQPTRGIRAAGAPLPSGQATYDDELLGAHFVCGDGRCNENIALSTIHTIFHSEHNRLATLTQRVVLDQGDLIFLNEWLESDSPATQAQLNSWPGLPFPTDDASLGNQEATRAAIEAWNEANDRNWDGERLFQAARFGTEMQYNRVVFDEFVPTLSGLKDPFEGFNNAVHPSITAEFSQAVYRFGHSMLNETVPRYDVNFDPIVDAVSGDPAQLGLFEAFLNPLALYNYDDAADGGQGAYTLSPEEATGAVIRGLTREVANEIDEFITGGMQNNLVGLPLDIGAINIARGRDVGVPRMNNARRAFFAASQDASVAPYETWMDYADNLRHETSLVNFIAAYGAHPTLAGDDGIVGNDDDPNKTVKARRAAACAIVGSLTPDAAAYCTNSGFSVAEVPADAHDFLYSSGTWAAVNDRPITGLENIDFWNGGLAEERRPFTGYLGATHNFVFENQMEALQNGDRFYYVGRTSTIHLFGELESNSFAALIMRNTDLGDANAGAVPLNIFSVANHILEVDQNEQFDAAGDGTTADPEGDSELIDLVIRDATEATTNINIVDPTRFVQYTGGDHVVIGGTEGDDTIVGGIGDDALWGRSGNDRIEGGDGADLIEGGPGDDIITDLSGPDVIEGGAGNDAISSGNEEDVIFGDSGSDFIINQSEFGEIFAGLDNDFIYDGVFIGHIRGGGGDDWMENEGGGEDLWQGDDGAAPEAGEPAVKGNDVFIAYGGNNDADMENGDDIIVDGEGIDRAEGQLGFDWISFANDRFGVNVDLDLSIFVRPILPPSNNSIQNRYDRVEGLSGSPLGDILRGTPNELFTDGGNAMSISTNASGQITTDGFALIEGLNATGDALPLVPDVERRELPADPVTGDAQFGWSNGEIVTGGGGSDLMVGEGGDDIIDGDSSLKVNIATPNPGLRSGSLGRALTTAGAVFANTNAAATAAEANAAATAAAADAAADTLSNEFGGLTGQQAADLAAVEAAEIVASDANEALLAAAQEAVDAAVNAAGLEQLANFAATAVTQAEADLVSTQNEVTQNDQEVIDAQATLTSAQTAASAADATVAQATATATAAQAASDAASDAAVTALLDFLMGSLTLADFNSAIGLATSAVVTSIDADDALAAAQATASGTTDAQDTAQQAFDSAQTAALGRDAAVLAAEQAVATAQASATTQAQRATDAVVAAAEAQQAAIDASNVASDADAALLAAQQIAEASSAAIIAATALADESAAAAAVAASDLELANLALANAQAELDAAEAALPPGLEANILVPSMLDVQEAIFSGAINPGELSISRVISDDDLGNTDTDSARYQGNFADYSIESDPGADGVPGTADDPGNTALDPAAFIGDFFSRRATDVFPRVREGDLDGFIEIIDNRVLPANVLPNRPGNDGRDLVRNVERLVFDDITIVLPAGAAGAGTPNNSVAVGQPTVTSSIPASSAPFETLMVSMTGVTDADNVHTGDPDFEDNPTGTVTSLVDYYWQAEAEPGSGVFTTIVRIGGNGGNGDAFEIHGDTFEATADDIGLQVRVEAIFQDDADVFEIVHSAAVSIAIPDGFVAPPGLVGIIPAAFLGTPDDIIAAIADQNVPLFENASKIGLPRLDLTIESVNLDLFANTGFGDVIGGADEVLVDSFLLTFTDSMGNVTGEFAPEIVAITDLLTGEVDQGNVDVMFSIRGTDVTDLIVPPFTIATLTVNGVEIANATFLGDSSVDSAIGVAITLVDQSPLLDVAGATFNGAVADVASPLTFETGATLPVDGFEIVVPNVAVNVFANTGFFGPGRGANEIGANSSVPVADGITLRFSQVIPVPPATDPAATGLFRPEIQAIVDQFGAVSQTEVDVVFELSDVEVEPLVRGLTFITIEVGGIPGTDAQTEILFGDSSRNFGEAVILLETDAQLQAAAELAVATATGNEGDIADATAALIAANLVAIGPGAAAAAELALAPSANFIGNANDINTPPFFENAGRAGGARLDFTIFNLRLDDFINHGFGDPIVAGDEIAVDRITLMFSNPLAEVTGVFFPEIVAIEDPATLDVDQNEVDLMWSIRDADVEPLVIGLTNVSVNLDGVPVTTIRLVGDSRIDDAANVTEVLGFAPVQAADVLASALIVADPAATAVAQASLAATMAAPPPPSDADGDGVANSADICPFDPADDVDADGVCGDADNCPFDANPAQTDSDSDGSGDTCDNCTLVANGPVVPDAGGNSQRDSDADGVGNVCDPDVNNDGFVNFADFILFQSGWLGGDPDLDLNGDGIVNFGDLAIFSNSMFGESE